MYVPCPQHPVEHRKLRLVRPSQLICRWAQGESPEHARQDTYSLQLRRGSLWPTFGILPDCTEHGKRFLCQERLFCLDRRGLQCRQGHSSIRSALRIAKSTAKDFRRVQRIEFDFDVARRASPAILMPRPTVCLPPCQLRIRLGSTTLDIASA